MARATYLEDTCKTALNRVPDAARVPFRWTINPYRGCTHACHYCFARAFHSYLDLGVGEDFSTKIVIKTNLVEVLRRELASPKWTGEVIAMGTATDPYQHCEGRFRLTRGVLEALIDAGQPALDAHEVDARRPRLRPVRAARRDRRREHRDEHRHARRGRPPGRRAGDAAGGEADRDPRPLRRGRASVRACSSRPSYPGSPTTTSTSTPCWPPARDAGLDWATVIPLHIRAGIRPHFIPWIQQAYPGLAARYERLYGPRAYAPRGYTEELTARFARLRERHGLAPTGGGTPTPAGARTSWPWPLVLPEVGPDVQRHPPVDERADRREHEPREERQRRIHDAIGC